MTPQELFAKIDDQITAHPELHNQSIWAGECGTTRCVAGWAVQLSKADPTESDWTFKYRYAREHGLDSSTYSDVATHLLGLDWEEAERLFFEAAEGEAREIVRRRAGRA